MLVRREHGLDMGMDMHMGGIATALLLLLWIKV